MPERRCHHDTTWSHVDGETICDACEEEVGEDFVTLPLEANIGPFLEQLEQAVKELAEQEKTRRDQPPDSKTAWARIRDYENSLMRDGIDMTDSYDIRVRALKNARVQQIEADLKEEA